jgi:small subunit ribosomal protein S18
MECYFCRHNFEEINFRDISLLKKFTSSLAKIKPRKKTGVCAFHQRRLAEAIKRARFLALLPYTTR